MKNSTRKYSKEFYLRDMILNAILDYSKLSKIELTEDEDYYSCKFTSCRIESQRIIYEFDNYLIELMNSNREG